MNSCSILTTNILSVLFKAYWEEKKNVITTVASAIQRWWLQHKVFKFVRIELKKVLCLYFELGMELTYYKIYAYFI